MMFSANYLHHADINVCRYCILTIVYTYLFSHTSGLQNNTSKQTPLHNATAVLCCGLNPIINHIMTID